MPDTTDRFSGISGDRPQLVVWRADEYGLHLQPTSEHGRFRRGEAYLVYAADEQPVPGRAGGPVLGLHVHSWAGRDADPAAVEQAEWQAQRLDERLGGRAVLHSELPGRESPRFRSYFRPSGSSGSGACKFIRYMLGCGSGGSAYPQPNPDAFSPCLYRVSGGARPVVWQLPRPAWSYFSDDKAFVIDTKELVFVWCGRTASGKDKVAAARWAQSFAGGRRCVAVTSGEEQTLPEDQLATLIAVLPLEGRFIRDRADTLSTSRAIADDNDDDENAKNECRDKPDPSLATAAIVNINAPARRLTEQTGLFICTGDNDNLKISPVKTGALRRDDLASDDVYVIDTGDTLWLWIGRRPAREQRVAGLRPAAAYLTQTGRRANAVPVCRVVDGAEPPEFKNLFADWTLADEEPVAPGGGGKLGGRGAATDTAKFDAAMLHNNASLAVQTQLVDDGSGRREVWRIEHGDLAPVPTARHGTFFSGDCYVIKYVYRAGGRERVIIYFWLGARSAQDERGAAALRTAQLNDQIGGRAVQVRVTQGKEPPHLMAIFNGRIVIHEGGKASLFDGPHAEDRDVGEVYLLQVRATGRQATRAVQVPLSAAALNSNDAFVLRCNAQQVYVWLGRGSVEQERGAARDIGYSLCDRPQMVEEGKESETLWDALGGQQQYASSRRLREQLLQPARLFHCSDASGQFRAKEVLQFDQSDLCEEDVMLLDTWHALWVWVGTRARLQEKREATAAALRYLATDPAGRGGGGVPVYMVHQGSEPPTFTGYFGAWDADLWSRQPCWPAVRSELAAAAVVAASDDQHSNNTPASPTRPVEVVMSADDHPSTAAGTFSLAAMRERQLPDSVDPAQREDYLSSEEFKAALGVSREEFNQMPVWKRKQRKREAGLF